MFRVVFKIKALAASQLPASNKMNWVSEHPGWCNSSTKQTLLKIDEACLHVNFKSDDFMAPLEVWGQSEKCEEVYSFL